MSVQSGYIRPIKMFVILHVHVTFLHIQRESSLKINIHFFLKISCVNRNVSESEIFSTSLVTQS